jgi:hypothetical protein
MVKWAAILMFDGNALVDERRTVCHSRERIDAAEGRGRLTVTADRMISNDAVLNEEERAIYLVETHQIRLYSRGFATPGHPGIAVYFAL